jgi:hypothetical protein
MSSASELRYACEVLQAVIRERLKAFRHPDFPYRTGDKPMPFVLHGMFWVGFWMPIGAMVFVGLKLLVGDVELTLYDQDVTSRDLLLGAGVIPITVAFVGIALAYGIWSKRAYPRYLSIVVLVAGALWANIRMFQTLSISWAPIAAAIGAIVSTKYLLMNPDVKEYYRGTVSNDVPARDVVG